MTTNTSKQVAADLEAEKANELVKPHALADSKKDEEPKWNEKESFKEEFVDIYNWWKYEWWQNNSYIR